MRRFIRKILDKAYREGGKAYQFISGCARRAENFLKTGWTVYIEKTGDIILGTPGMATATAVEVYFLIYPISDLKFNKYRAREDKIISEINFLLKNEGIKDWIVIKSGNFFRTTRLGYFTASRPKPILYLGKPSLWETVQLVGQLLIMKGFYIADVQIKEQGKLIYQAWQLSPSATDIYVLETLMAYSKRESVIDRIVEGVIEEEAKPPEPDMLKKIEWTATKIIIAAVVIMMIYLLIVYQAPIKLGFRALEKKLEKKKE